MVAGTALCDSDLGTTPAGRNAAIVPPPVVNIYPTILGGREWFLPDDTNLNKDAEFVPEGSSVISIVQAGPSTIYHTNGNGTNAQVRLNVHSPLGKAWWRNVEMTAYYRYTGIIGFGKSHWEDEVRTERHSIKSVAKGQVNDGVPPPNGTTTWPWWHRFHNSDPINPHALGTAYHGNIYVTNGTDPSYSLFEKELSHMQGYATDQRSRLHPSVLPPTINRWFGYKFIVRNNPDATAVKMEQWLDPSADGNWIKINEYTDQNGQGRDWVAYVIDDTDFPPYNIALNQLITWAGPWVTFRSDNLGMDFRQLSVREIAPDGSPSRQSPSAP